MISAFEKTNKAFLEVVFTFGSRADRIVRDIAFILVHVEDSYAEANAKTYFTERCVTYAISLVHQLARPLECAIHIATRLHLIEYPVN
jgi:hypothetical protein